MLNFHLDEKADITVGYKKMARNEVKKETIFSTYDFEEGAGKEIINVTPLTELPYDPAPIAFGLDVLVTRTEVFLEYLERLKNEKKLVSVGNIVKDAVQNDYTRSEEHTSELQSRGHLVCRLLLEKK